MILKVDFNRDGDHAYTLETMVYLNDPDTTALLWQSYSAAYQKLIESIEVLKFKRAHDLPHTCIKVTVQAIIDIAEQ